MAAQPIADGPLQDTVWCILTDPPPALLAPGGVVLCRASDLTPHDDAQRAADSAWELLRHWMVKRGGRRAHVPFSPQRGAR